MLVYINPKSSFPNLHSDTLFGALTYAISELYPEELEGFLDLFKNKQAPFLLSSTFPFINFNDEKVRFFPKIISNLKNLKFKDEIHFMDKNKEFKKIDFIEESIFLGIISGKTKEEDIINNLQDYVTSNNLLHLKDSFPKEFRFKNAKSLDPHNVINRLTNESEGVFYGEGTQYKNMGLFFLVKFEDDSFKDILISALRFLEDRGFGVDISTGKGQFTFETEDFTFEDIEGDYFTNLSRFIPSKEDLKIVDKNSSYEIGFKRGTSREGQLRKQVRFFKEGSTFKKSDDVDLNNLGSIVESGDKALEYGFAFTVSVKS